MTKAYHILYRRGSWRPIGHMRPSSPLLDSVRDLFEGQEDLAKDFTRAFTHFDGNFPDDSNNITKVTKVEQRLKMSSFRTKKGIAATNLPALRRFETESLDSSYRKDNTTDGIQKKIDLESSKPSSNLFDVTFVVGQGKVKTKLFGVRAILGVRSRYKIRIADIT